MFVHRDQGCLQDHSSFHSILSRLTECSLKQNSFKKDFKPQELNLQCAGTFKSKVIQEGGCDSSNTACFQNSKSVFSYFLYFLGGRERFLFHPYFTFCRSCPPDFLMSNNPRSATNKFELFSIFSFTTFHNYINQCSLHQASQSRPNCELGPPNFIAEIPPQHRTLGIP